jgi:NtrC-family two-component system response regulator AlgB
VKGFTPAAEELVRRYPWPGNLRELHNTIERAVILSSSDRLDAADLPTDLRQRVGAPAGAGDEIELRVGSMVSIDQLEEQHIRRVIENCVNLNDAANVLGIDQATLYRKRKKMGLKAKAAAASEPAAEPVTPARPARP